jgi:cold shock CspA family protein
VLREAIEASPLDKDLNYQLARLLMRQPNPNKAEIRHFLRSSFTNGDTRSDAQFWYARFLYLEGEVNEARDYFLRLKDAAAPTSVKQKPRGRVMENNNPVKYLGTVAKIEASFGFISKDARNEDVFISRFHDHRSTWDDLYRGKRVRFELAFNYRGPVAINVEGERPD